MKGPRRGRRPAQRKRLAQRGLRGRAGVQSPTERVDRRPPVGRVWCCCCCSSPPARSLGPRASSRWISGVQEPPLPQPIYWHTQGPPTLRRRAALELFPSTLGSPQDVASVGLGEAVDYLCKYILPKTAAAPDDERGGAGWLKIECGHYHVGGAEQPIRDRSCSIEWEEGGRKDGAPVVCVVLFPPNPLTLSSCDVSWPLVCGRECGCALQGIPASSLAGSHACGLPGVASISDQSSTHAPRTHTQTGRRRTGSRGGAPQSRRPTDGALFQSMAADKGMRLRLGR